MTSGREVRATESLIRLTSSLPASTSTPALLYVSDSLAVMISVSGAAGIRAEAGIISQVILQWTEMSRFDQTDCVARAGLVLIAAAVVGTGSSGLSAAIVEDLYSVTVIRSVELAPGQVRRTQQDEIRFALGQLLPRVTGRLDAALEPALADLLQNAEDYVEQIGALDRETLLVTFDARAIEEALIARDQPIWGPERPLTLLWLAIDTGQGERGILAAGEAMTDISPEFLELQANFRDQLSSVAEERGLPLSLPLMDLQDMSALSYIDIVGGFTDQLSKASIRYGADAVLTGLARVTRSGVNVQWTLLKDGGRFALGGTLMRDGLNRLADLYAAEFSTFGGVRTTLITVLGIETLEDYGRVMRYLESLSLLEAVGVEEFVDGALSIRVYARGGTTVLERVLALGNILTPAVVPLDQVANNTQLAFTLTR